MAQGFSDHFSSVARDYAAFRPHYSPELFSWIASLVPHRERALDCGTGNGQSAIALAGHFKEVIATDASAEQIAAAMPHERVIYRVAPANASGLPDASVDLITASAAAHWFPHDAFHREVRRIGRKHAIIALWSYTWSRINAELDELIRHFALDPPLGPFWPPERRIVDTAYRDLPFPFAAIDAPAFELRYRWTADRYLGYMSTWSSVQRFRKEKGTDPIALVVDAFRRAWGPEEREVVWPLALRVGMVH